MNWNLWMVYRISYAAQPGEWPDEPCPLIEYEYNPNWLDEYPYYSDIDWKKVELYLLFMPIDIEGEM
jgi:hypothetical protein